MDPATIGAAAAAVSAAISGGRLALDKLKQRGHAESAATVFDLIDALLTAKEALIEAQQALQDDSEQKALLAKRKRIEDTYWIDDEGPFCTKCWDADGQPILLHGVLSSGAGRCPNCKTFAIHDRAAHQQHRKSEQNRFPRAQEEIGQPDDW